MSGERRKINLGDVANIVMGQSPPGDTVTPDHGIALLNGPTEFGPHHPTPAQFTTDARKLAQPGDLLFCVRGSTTGRMNWADQEYAIGRGVAAIRHRRDAVLQPLVRGVIEVELPELLTRATGSTFPNVSAQQLAEIPYPILEETEQRAIAGVLGTLDDKIELNRRMNETLEQMARALFKSWFVDFDPVRAKIEGRWHPGQSLPGLPAHLYDLFPSRLVSSELGPIPAGWHVRAFGTLLADVIGGDWGKETPDVNHTQPVSVIRGTDLPALALGGTGSVPLRYTTKAKAKRRILRDGDIIIEVSGGSPTQSTGRSMMVTRDILSRFPGTVVCASFCRRFRPKGWREAVLASRHLDFLNASDKMWEYQLQSTGIANFQTNLFLEEEKVIWPGDGLMNEFAELVEPIVNSTTRNESITLATQRDTLLPGLVSGDVRVAIR